MTTYNANLGFVANTLHIHNFDKIDQKNAKNALNKSSWVKDYLETSSGSRSIASYVKYSFQALAEIFQTVKFDKTIEALGASEMAFIALPGLVFDAMKIQSAIAGREFPDFSLALYNFTQKIYWTYNYFGHLDLFTVGNWTIAAGFVFSVGLIAKKVHSIYKSYSKITMVNGLIENLSKEKPEYQARFKAANAIKRVEMLKIIEAVTVIAIGALAIVVSPLTGGASIPIALTLALNFSALTISIAVFRYEKLTYEGVKKDLLKNEDNELQQVFDKWTAPVYEAYLVAN